VHDLSVKGNQIKVDKDSDVLDYI
jgi:hypothetical protein